MADDGWDKEDDNFYANDDKHLVMIRETADTVSSLFLGQGYGPGWYVFKFGHQYYGKKKNRQFIGPFNTVGEAKKGAAKWLSEQKAKASLEPARADKKMAQSVAAAVKKPKKTDPPAKTGKKVGRPKKKVGERGTR